LSAEDSIEWDNLAIQELNKIPGFVRGKIKRNIDKYAKTNGIKIITIDIMYAAKEKGAT